MATNILNLFILLFIHKISLPTYPEISLSSKDSERDKSSESINDFKNQEQKRFTQAYQQKLWIINQNRINL